MRAVAIPIALMFLAGSAAQPARAALEESPYAERSERTVDPAGLSGLEVDNASGRVELTASADGRLHVVATKLAHARRPEEARRIASRTTVDAGPEGGRYAIRVHYPHVLGPVVGFWDLMTVRGRQGLHGPGVEVRLEIQVPRGWDVRVATASGDIASHGLSGPQTLRTASGDVEATDAAGAIDARSISGELVLRAVGGVRARSTSGNVTVEGVAALDAASTSGDISVAGARQPLALETVSGDIVVADAPAGLHARSTSGELLLRGACARVDVGTQSGAIRARLRGPLDEAKVHSVSGEVGLELVPGLGASLTVHSASGSIDCDAPVTLVGHDRHSLDARLGRGGPPVRIETVSGNVHITNGGH